MGRSDPAVYSFYTRYVTRRLDLSLVRTAAYLGWQAVPSFMRKYPFASCCYDVVNEDGTEGTRHWDINRDRWDIAGYDLVMVNRVTIFSKSVRLLLQELANLVKRNKCVVCDFITGARVCGNIALLTHYREILSGPVNVVDLSGLTLSRSTYAKPPSSVAVTSPHRLVFSVDYRSCFKKREVAKTLPVVGNEDELLTPGKMEGAGLQMTSIEMVRLPAEDHSYILVLGILKDRRPCGATR